MLTLIVAALLVLSNVTLFYVLVNLLKPGQRRIFGLDQVNSKSEPVNQFFNRTIAISTVTDMPIAESGLLMTVSLYTPCTHVARDLGCENHHWAVPVFGSEGDPNYIEGLGHTMTASRAFFRTAAWHAMRAEHLPHRHMRAGVCIMVWMVFTLSSWCGYRVRAD